MAANVSAQTDITPSRYKFSNQEVGLYQIDYVNAGANPANALPAVVENFNNGFVMLAGAPPIYTGIDSDGAKTVQSGLNIFDASFGACHPGKRDQNMLERCRLHI